MAGVELWFYGELVNLCEENWAYNF